MTLHPQIVTLMAAMERPDRPAIHELPIEEARLVYGAMPRFMGDLGYTVPSEDRIISGPHGDIPIRVYRPDGSTGRPIVVFYHGGGFCIGNLDTHGRECEAISAKADCIVVSVDYRMGPEFAYTAERDTPVWIDDAWAAFTWTADNATELGGDGDRMVVCGDSAGGNISAVMAQMARDNGRPLALQVLVYPATDVRADAYDRFPSYQEHRDAPILERPVLEYFEQQSRPGGDASSPAMSPALADRLTDLAPALILTAEYDPLRDDGETYGRLLEEAGVPVTVKRFDGMPHGFFNLGPHVDAAFEAMNDVAAAIASL